MERVILAKTWNKNDAGTLWEGWWYIDENGYHSDGTYQPKPTDYLDEKAFWKAWRKQKKEFYGSKCEQPNPLEEKK